MAVHKNRVGGLVVPIADPIHVINIVGIDESGGRNHHSIRGQAVKTSGAGQKRLGLGVISILRQDGGINFRNHLGRPLQVRKFAGRPIGV